MRQTFPKIGEGETIDGEESYSLISGQEHIVEVEDESLAMEARGKA